MASGGSSGTPATVPWSGAATAKPASRPASAVGGGTLGSRTRACRRAFVFPEQGTAGEVYPALWVNLMEYHGYLLAHLYVVFFQVTHLSVAQQPVPAWDQLNEYAKVGDPRDLAGKDVSDQQFPGQAIHLGPGTLHVSAVDATDGDRPVVLNVDGGAGFFNDGPYDAAAGSDEGADLLHRYLKAQHLGGIIAHLGARLIDHFVHFCEDVQTADPGLLQCLFQDLLGKPSNFDVHLKGVDPVGGTRHLEIHVAQEVFHSLDVAEDGIPAVFPGDQAHGDAGDGFLQGNSRIHQGQGSAANAAHGRASVGAEHLRNHADGVWELLFRWKRRQYGPFRKSAVAYLPAARRSDPPGFSGGEGGEIVVVHEPFGVLGTHRIQPLLQGHRTQSYYGQHLGFSPVEQPGAVGAGQYAHLAGNRPYLS